MSRDIVIKGIETNNLKNIDIQLKKNSINLVIGPSGSGKSTLAYDTVAQIGQHEFMSMFADNISEPTYKVSSFSNMSAAVPIKQTNYNNNLRSTIGTYFGLNRSIGYIYASILNLPEDLFVLNKEDNLCPECHGLGTISMIDPNKVIDYNIPLNKNPFKCWNKYKDFYCQIIELFCKDNGIKSELSFRELNDREKKLLLYGESKEKYSIRYKKTNAFSRRTTKYYGFMTGIPLLPNHNIGKQFFSEKECPCCKGKKYSNDHDKYKVCDLSIGDFMTTSFSELGTVLRNMSKINQNDSISFSLEQLSRFVNKANELNLGHLFLHRSIPTLSGGELQRLRMVQVFNTQLNDLIIVLDEPLSGLSGNEKDFVFNNIVDLSQNHTLMVVDHSDRFLDVSSNVIALGEVGGSKGGYIIDSKKYLKSQVINASINVPQIKEITEVKVINDIYKYKGVDIQIANNRMNLITGPSGIGKSTLLREYFPQFFDKYKYINQKPLLGNKNSSVATSLEIAQKISEIFAKKYKKDKKFFSNLTGNEGACPICGGAGYIEYGSEQSSLTHLSCKECEGTGFNKNLKKYRVKDKNIFDIWKMTISEGIDYFIKIDQKIADILKDADSLLIGHLLIGQQTGTLSGGENIRIKILKYAKTSSTVLGIDEPFKGLNPNEIFKMAEYLDGLRISGKTIVVIDHTDNIERFFSKHVLLKNNNGILIG